MKKTELSFWLVFWAAVLYAAIYPWLKPAPVEDIASLADWQIPSKLGSLDAADQRKLLKRLAYPVAMPELLPVPDFEQYKDVVEKKKAFLLILRHIPSNLSTSEIKRTLASRENGHRCVARRRG